jgi:hypothetical protein
MDKFNDIQPYTSSDVGRTAFAYQEVHARIEHSLGAGLTHGVNQICICCKGGSTSTDKGGNRKTHGYVSRIRDEADLKPWTDYYTKSEFQAYKCHSCGYQWSWFRPKTTIAKEYGNC